ncbi:MAG: GYD domain-containing protein [Burkholderiaceae bacterium]|nr:GYD domain-containing protein [Burkholderiaceae bacterium]
MAKYIALASFTDQGIRGVKDTLKRADGVREAARKFGCELSQIYWTLGQYDLVTVIEAPDESSATAFGLAIGSSGNVRTQTMRAFTRDEMATILGKLG